MCLIVAESIHSSGIGTAPTLLPIHPARENENYVFMHTFVSSYTYWCYLRIFSGIMEVVETFAAVCHNSRMEPWSQSYKHCTNQFL